MLSRNGIPAFKIYLDASPDVRMARVGLREGETFEEAHAKTIDRQRSEAKRYMMYYGIDIEDPRVDHLVDGGVLLGDGAELPQGQVFLRSKLTEDLPEDNRFETELLGPLAAGGRLPGSGRTADGYSHSISALLTSLSSSARCFLRKMNLISLFSICPIGRLTMV